ncbi:hypothetical protein GCM10025768_02220 [Microbacterium pseudoresistens]|uniref:Putative nucleic acid-binding Zn ribbon protein n=1 Tax=Microbacterium pseudoresistens TaxID=640634 RepID=A0A7Y9EU84_9MICO|nr:DciA family protein [Microbacterium pseudoresistens]NYD54057.1 putative nucleic acid-binding Zn ribbon protein [Microbacterium pseudoresistens]
MTDPTPVPDVPETIATYLRLRGLKPSAKTWKKRKRLVDDENQPFTKGRDPGTLGDVLGTLSKDAGWEAVLSREDLVRQWDELAGPDTAKHSEPVSLEGGLLTVKCDSTAWAKNLQYMRAVIVTEIERRYPEAGVKDVRFVGPDVPSWKWGPRAVPGRGPRDTYG